ncbi:MAG: protein kinase [Actinomycetota bacterium]
MAEQAGTLVGHYRLVSTIGSGGFSTVYRAVDERLEAEVAVKVLAENHALDPEVRERFVAEAQLLRRIEGPAVIAVHDVGETDRAQPFIVMAYADRGDLGSRAADLWVRARHQVTAHEALRVAQTLADGLGRAHRAGLVHRDVTPANLLLATDPTAGRGDNGRATPDPAHPQASAVTLIGADERLLLSDLGFGKDLLASSGLTVGGGTAGFAAPEQQAPHTTVDARADIHAASAVLHWLFARRAPSPIAGGPSDDERLPPGLAPVLRRGLAVDPDHRHTTIEAWFTEVEQALAPSPTASPVTADRATATSPATADRATARGPGGEGGPTAAAPGRPGGLADVGAVPFPAPRHDIDDERPPRRPVPAAATLIAGIAVGLLLALGAVVVGLVGGDDTTAAVADDGTLTITAERDGLTLAVSGPEAVALGERIELAAVATGHTGIHWFAPAGGTGEGEALTLQTGRTGVATITAVAVDEVGRAVTVEFPVTVE